MDKPRFFTILLASNLFRLLSKYRPESKEEKKARRTAEAGGQAPDSKKPKVCACFVCFFR